MLHSGLDYLERGLQEEEINDLAEIYQEWLPSDQDAKEKIIELGENEEYKNIIQELRNRYSPKDAKLYADREIKPQDQEMINKLFTEDELNDRLSRKSKMSKLLYQMFSVSAKVGGAIIGFAKVAAKGTVEILKKLGKPLIEATSTFKQKLKQRKNIHSALRICIVVASYPIASAIYSQFPPMILEFIPIESDSIPGLRGAIEKGLFLILNG